MAAIPLSKFGLVTVDEAAARRDPPVSARTVQRWIEDGLIDYVQVGDGRNKKFLLRIKDVDAFVPNAVGAPAGNENARKTERVPKKKEKAKKRKKVGPITRGRAAVAPASNDARGAAEIANRGIQTPVDAQNFSLALLNDLDECVVTTATVNKASRIMERILACMKRDADWTALNEELRQLFLTRPPS